MGTETINKPPVRKYALVVIATFILIFLIYYSVMNLLSPVRKLEELKKEYAFRQNEKNKIDERVFNDSAYLKLLKDRSFLQSRVAMAETDSIYLTINLADSIVNLEISGVSVHKTKIKKLNISKMLRDDNSYTISSFLSKPFNISKNYSSIPKVPLMIKMAPKDTSEYIPDIFPDTADYEPVNYIMAIENGTRIIVYQEEKLNPGDNIHLFWFDLRYRLRNTLESLKSSLTFKVPEYHPFIKLRLPRADAKIIYRALPEHGQIAVYR
ncbi:MAG: hypothetical protein NTZ85_07680 [Bacteroidia bacterium]|jgi:hypothetical protein|nr:hypothetical protein [Bacteroidia bacterium]